ncbi:MAG TPA: tetratricopeptide repeat protein [Ktedonosporobacter sp.]|nr:tetratricopeptide repeat protein [Ktedonosporobacter sp.]
MSKKSKRAKRQAQSSRPGIPLPQRVSIPLRMYERVEYARQQMFMGDFVGCIRTCEPLLAPLPKRSHERLEVLMLLGLAHGMLQQYQQSYDIFSEAIALEPTFAESWYNRGLACHYLARPGEAVQNFERAVELSKDEPGEMARKFALQLEEGRRELQEAMLAHGTDITFEQYLEREEWFTQALRLVKQEQWHEAEGLFRQLTEMGSRIPSYWGNLGVCLLMQLRYEEAEAALKQALAVDPDYSIARDNLKKLPELRRSKRPVGHKLINPHREAEAKQSLTLYEKDSEGEVIASTVIEKVGHAVTSSGRRLGKQPPRYDFLLNPYPDLRFTTCPRCQGKTHLRKFSLVVHVNPDHTAILDKRCRFCDACDLLMVHQRQLEGQLTTECMVSNPKVIGNNYQVVGTLDRAKWDQGKQATVSFEHLREHLHDFKEVVTLQ